MKTCCGYSVKTPYWSAFNEYHNVSFHGEIRKISTYFRWKRKAPYQQPSVCQMTLFAWHISCQKWNGHSFKGNNYDMDIFASPLFRFTLKRNNLLPGDLKKIQYQWRNFLSSKVVSLPKIVIEYSRTLLSRTRLFRITAYLEAKIWSLF